MKIKIKGGKKKIYLDDIDKIINLNGTYLLIDTYKNVYEVKQKSYKKIEKIIENGLVEDNYFLVNEEFKNRNLFLEKNYQKLKNAYEQELKYNNKLQTECDNFEKQNRLLIDEIAQSKYDELKKKYQDLEKTHNELKKEYENLKEEAGSLKITKIGY